MFLAVSQVMPSFWFRGHTLRAGALNIYLIQAGYIFFPVLQLGRTLVVKKKSKGIWHLLSTYGIYCVPGTFQGTVHTLPYLFLEPHYSLVQDYLSSIMKCALQGPGGCRMDKRDIALPLRLLYFSREDTQWV